MANAQRVFNVASRIAEAYKEGNSVVVTVSAQGDTTDDLIEKAREINPKPSRREMDMLLATGEQISISLLSMALEQIGIPSVSMTGWQAGIQTDSNYGMAKIKRVNTERILSELDAKKVVVVAGFQGINRYDDITTLGRGGSDTSAVALAAALHADLCQIYTDVDGVYTTDPRICPDAVKIEEITYDEMLELASLGANVLMNRSVELAKKYNVNLEVLSSLHKVPGTIIKEVTNVEKSNVRGIARDNDVAMISVLDVPDEPGIAFKVFSMLAKHNINVDMILQSIGREDKKDISFSVKSDDCEEAVKLLSDNNIIHAREIIFNNNVSKVSIVGAGMVSNPGIASMMFEAMYDAHINIHMICTSEIKVSILIDREYADKAVRALHDKYNLANNA